MSHNPSSMTQLSMMLSSASLLIYHPNIFLVVMRDLKQTLRYIVLVLAYSTTNLELM